MRRSLNTQCRVAIALWTAVVALAFSLGASAGCLRYTVDIIQPPSCGGWSPSIVVSAISQSGELVGTRSGCGDTDGGPYAWYGAPPIINLQPFMPQGMTGDPTGINSSRQIVGHMRAIGGGGSIYGFRLHNGVLTNLGMLPGHIHSYAFSINQQGTICGRSHGPEGRRACIWSNGQIAPLDLPIGPNSEARDISNDGRVCGMMGPHAFLWSSEGVIDLGVGLPNAMWGVAMSLNDTGATAGYSTFSDPIFAFARRGFLWSDGHVVDLGVLPGLVDCFPNGLNDNKIVVGYCADQFGTGTAFVWKDGVMRNLEELVPSELNLWIISATGINNAGQIAAFGITLNNGASVALRLNPVPPLVGDVNCDWTVNVFDLLEVVRNWGPCPPPVPPLDTICPADINRDGTINVSDLLAVINNWSF